MSRSLLLLALLHSTASAADSNNDGCEDVFFDANTACVAPDASIGAGVTVGTAAIVGRSANIGPDTALGDRAFIGGGSVLVGRVAEIGPRPIGADTILGRRTNIGADHDIGALNTFGRAVTAGARLQVTSNVSVGYAGVLGDDVTIQSGAALGNLVDVGNKTTILAGTVLARNVTVLDSTTAASIGGVLGPNVSVGGDCTISTGARIRKDTVIGTGVTIIGNARIGRDATIEDGATIGAGARIGADATVPSGAVVPDDFFLRRGETFNGTGGVENCSSGVDDDGDGLGGCLDPQCSTDPVCTAPEPLDPLFVFAAPLGDSGDELWISDGTVAGTAMLPEVNPSATSPFDVDGCLADDNDFFDCEIFFPDDCEFFDPNANPYCGADGGSSPGDFIAMGAHLYFTADDGQNGRELWRTDGSAVERMTDINPNGSSFDTPNEFEDRPTDSFGVQGDYLYFIADTGDGRSPLFRYSDASGVEAVPMANSAIDSVTGPIAAFDGVVYAITRLPTGSNRDVLAFDGVNPAVLLGVPAASSGPTGLAAVDYGIVIHGNNTTYGIYGYAPNEPTPAVVSYGGSPALREPTLFNGRLCAIAGSSTDGTLLCFDGRPGLVGMDQLGPSGLRSSGDGAVVGTEQFCFNSVIANVGYRVSCSDGQSPAAPLVGNLDGVNLDGHEGSLYLVERSSGQPYRYDFDGSSPAPINSDPGEIRGFIGLPGQDTVGLPVKLSSSGELRFYHPSDGTMDVAVIAPSGDAVPKRLTAWVR